MTRIWTDGYRGIRFGNILIPAGAYEVGDSLDIAGGVIDGEQAAHMLAIGRAVLVEAPVLDQSEPADGPDPAVETEDAVEADEPELYVEGTSIYEQYTVAEMREMAEQRGIDLSGLRVRNEIIRRLDEADRAEAE